MTILTLTTLTKGWGQIVTPLSVQEHRRVSGVHLKQRLVKEGNETVTNCNQLKLKAGTQKGSGVHSKLYQAGNTEGSPVCTHLFVI